MKKSILLLFAALLPLVANAHDFEFDGIYYNITSEEAKTAEVTYKGDNPYKGGWYSGSITIPATVTYDGVAYSVTSIGEEAFSKCSSLTAINIPEGVTSIGSGAFYGCSSLTAIVVAEGNKVYDSRGGCNAIIETASNTLILGCSTTIIPESVTSIGEGAFFSCRGLTDITLPESSQLTSIGYIAFYDCSSLTAINIPEGVTSIGNWAFWGCSSLTAITLPEGVTSIGERAFDGCNSLTDIIVAEGNAVYDSRGGCNAIIETSSNILITGCSATIIPKSVTSIGDAAFSECSGLTAINIPEGVKSIGSNAFYNCRYIESIVLPNGLETIDFSAFAFCPNLEEVYCYAENIPSAKPNAFDGSNLKHAVLHVPDGSIDSYKAASPWSKFSNMMTDNEEAESQKAVIGVQGTFDLNGRSITGEGLPRPNITTQAEGRVVVTITVNPEGEVVATNINLRTNTSDPELRKVAEEAAKRARFNKTNGVDNQMGTITYYFRKL